MEFCQQSLLREWTFHDVRNQMRDGVFRRVEEALRKGDRERDEMCIRDSPIDILKHVCYF